MIMNKKLCIAILLTITLTGCNHQGNIGSYSSEYQVALSTDDELKDCTAKYVRAEGSGITVVRCPNSTTTTRYISDKIEKTNIVIDGVNYVPEK